MGAFGGVWLSMAGGTRQAKPQLIRWARSAGFQLAHTTDFPDVPILPAPSVTPGLQLPAVLCNRPAIQRKHRRNPTIRMTGFNQCNNVSDCSHFEYVCHAFAPLARGLLKDA
jgi:hypothetical protein